MAKRSQIIVDDYLDRIVSGRMIEGQLLPTETAMIEQYNVSRTAVREAIQTLATKGFVQMVKDLRTEYEVGNPQAVLDGDIDGFIEAAIRWRRRGATQQ